MNKKQLLFIALAALLLVSAIGMAANGYTIPRHVIAGGGGVLQAGKYTLHSTIGQPLAHTSQNEGGYALTSGYWPGGEPGLLRIYLPLIVR